MEIFHPSVATWFRQALGEPTPPQEQGWPLIAQGIDTLIAAPTGSGKTLAAFLSAINDLVVHGIEGDLPAETRVLYISPLKALSNDVRKNLEIPLAGIREELERMGITPPEITVEVRTGDTPASERTRMIKNPPHIFVTTPESVYILLTSEGGRRLLSTVRTVIVDEIHALVRDKRGSHLALSLARLDKLTGQRAARVGLSATQKPIERVAEFLVGCENGAPRTCQIVDSGHKRTLDLQLELPGSPMEPVMSAEVWSEVCDRLVALIASHTSTLIFVNTRRLAERLTAQLTDRLGEDAITSHHGSLSKEKRLAAESRLKSGELKALVATASLELGIDIGAVDLVCQIGSARSIATLLQRVGRASHAVGGVPTGRVFPTTRDELVECCALLDAVRRGELDELIIPDAPLDILAQQIVAAVSCEEWGEEELFELARSASPYRALKRKSYDDVLGMLSEGFSTRRGRRGAYLHRDAVNRRLRGRKAARLTALTNGGAIPDLADYQVILEPSETMVGTLNEDFAIESMPGDIFQLGNTSWQILRIEPGKVRVQDAKGQPPTIPFWFGEAPARTPEASLAVSRLRADVSARLPEDLSAPEALTGAIRFLADEVGVVESGARQVVEYLASVRAALGSMPTQENIVAERFFDEAGDHHLVIHSPFGARLNRAWGLSLRKRFCRSFNFELQAAATDDAIILSLGPTHSFPLEEVFTFLRAHSVRTILVQAMLDAPMFPTRWRWNANRSLAVPRFRNGKRVPPAFQRMDADDLVAVCFPDQLACLENIQGDREIPDHPLVQQTIADCLTEAMDIVNLERLLGDIEAGKKTLIARDVTEPSPLAQEILNARPYAFLDDAPLEERRTQAVRSRRFMDPATTTDLGELDQAAIDLVCQQSWPLVRSADELHEALLLLGFLTDEEGIRGSIDEEASERANWSALLDVLRRERRATILETKGGRRLWVAAERLALLCKVHADLTPVAAIEIPSGFEFTDVDADKALVELLRGRMEGLGPVTAPTLADSADVSLGRVNAALVSLESEGFVFQGRFTPGTTETEWCERRLLARIYRQTLGRLRKEIEPVSAADFMRFLFDWQHVTAATRVQGQEGLRAIAMQLEGFELPAVAWEGEAFPARLTTYDPAWFDALSLSGSFVWSRLTRRSNSAGEARAATPIRTTPIGLLRRQDLDAWQPLLGTASEDSTEWSSVADKIYSFLVASGASFFSDIVRGTGLLRSQVEDGLGELVAWGRVTADSFAGMRALLIPAQNRPTSASQNGGLFGMESAGRWSLLSFHPRTQKAGWMDDASVTLFADAVLRRYGVVFRRLLERERLAPSWGQLLRVLRTKEARGEIRGGRFVNGFSGEQFALPEAVTALRSIRKRSTDGELVCVCAADPLNLTGITSPGERIAALTTNQVLYRNGEPVAVRENGATRLLAPIDLSEMEINSALIRRPVAPKLRKYIRN